MTPNEPGRVDELLKWCKKEDIWIHPALEIKSTSFETVRYVVIGVMELESPCSTETRTHLLSRLLSFV